MRKTISSWLWLFSLLIVCSATQAQTTYTLFDGGLSPEVSDFTSKNPSEVTPWEYSSYNSSTSIYSNFTMYSTGGKFGSSGSWCYKNTEYFYLGSTGGAHMKSNIERPAIRFKAPSDGYYKMSAKMTRDNYGAYNQGKAQVYAYFNFVTSAGMIRSMEYDIPVSINEMYAAGTYFTQKSQEIYVYMNQNDYVTFELGVPATNGSAGTTWDLVQVATVSQVEAETALNYYNYYSLADKTVLEALLSEVTDWLNRATVSTTNEPGTWTQAQVSALQTVKDAAQLVMEQADATTTQVDGATLSLSAAQTLFISQRVIRLENEETFASAVYYIKVGDQYLTAPAMEKGLVSLSSLIANGGKNNQMWNVQYNATYSTPDRYTLVACLAGSTWDIDGDTHLDEIGRVQNGNTESAQSSTNSNNTWRNHSLYYNGDGYCIYNVKNNVSINATSSGTSTTTDKQYLYTFVPVVSDFTTLQPVIDEMDSFLATVVTGENPGDYSATEKAVFEGVLNGAKALVASGFSSLEIIAAQKEALLAAKETFVKNVTTLVMDPSHLPSGAYYIMKDGKYLTAGWVDKAVNTFAARNSGDLRDNQVWNIQFDYDNTTRNTKNYSLTSCLSGKTWTMDGDYNLSEEGLIRLGHTAFVQDGGNKTWRTFEISFNGTQYSLYATCTGNHTRRGYLSTDEEVTVLQKSETTDARSYEFTLVPVEEFTLLYPENVATNTSDDLVNIKKAVLCNAKGAGGYTSTWLAEHIASLKSALGNADGLLEVDAQEAALVEGVNLAGILETVNPNALLYVSSSVHAAGEPAVINGVATSLILTDEKPFYASQSFIAGNVSYTRSFNEAASGAYSTAAAPRWQTICLPFDVEKVEGACPVVYNEGDPAHNWAGGTRELSADSDYWLYELTPTGFIRTTTGVKANIPYIIAFPYSWEDGIGYSPKLNVSGAVTFSGNAITATEAQQADNGTYVLVNNFASIDAGSNVYVLSEDGQYFDSEAEATATSFRPYALSMLAAAPSRIYLNEGGEVTGTAEIEAIPSNFDIVTIPGGVEVTCKKACSVEVATLSGALLGIFQLNEGVQQISLPVGVVLVDGVKVIVTE